MNENVLRDLANQLSCPKDSDGIKMSYTMLISNLALILNTIGALNIQDSDTILELGQGNAGHLAYLFSLANDVHYTGLEVSETMYLESLKLNKAFCDAKLAEFALYDGNNIPFTQPTFDKIFTVNTIYFWQDPAGLLDSLTKVLKKGGLLAITLSDKTFMEKLPFIKYGFKLYEPSDLTKLFSNLPIKLYQQSKKQDIAISKDGKLVNRIYHTLVYQKC